MQQNVPGNKNTPATRKPLAIAVALATLAATPAVLAQDLVLEEVLVTARKKVEAMQDVPVSMQALGGDRLTELGISSFNDYALMLPNLSFKSFGTPGSATIIMRGAADGGDGNASGSQPSVGLYLDEQPVTSIASNLDVHIYDIARIEALAGPQATLFGASSQSGTLRIITNKPNSDAFEARIDVGVGATDGGDESYSGEGMVNIPISDNAALRLVGWAIDEGGWIDNVPGTRTYQLEGGYGYNPNNFGRTRTINNDKQVEDDFNETQKTGARAALKVDLNENWTTTASILYQNIDSDGVWEYDHVNFGGDEDKIQRFTSESNEDEFTQFGLTIEGEAFNHNIVFAGSYLDRDVDYTTDYSAYGEDAYFVPYYACDYSASGANLETQSNTDCTSLYEFYDEDNEYTRQSYELRLQSLGEGRLQYTLGLFWQENEHEYFLQWRQPDMAPTLAYDGDDLYFRTDQKRTDTQFAAFGELSFDITETLTATAGMRYYDEESEVDGVVGWGPANYGTRDTTVDSKVDFDDEVYKFGLSWNVTDDAMLFVTYSEGYRPGGLNRDPGLIETAGTQSWTPDQLDNYELGWKTTWMDSRLRFNGALYYMEWDDIQYTIYDFGLSACCGNVYNLSTAEISGLEFDVTFLPFEGMSVSMGASYNDAETTDDFIIPSQKLVVPDGTELPNVPEWKFASQWRYDFNVSDFDTFVQLSASYTDESWSEIRPSARFEQDSFTIVNLRAGLARDNWGVDFYVDNLTDEVAQYYVQPRNYEPTTVTNRPINYGAKFWMTFD